MAATPRRKNRTTKLCSCGICVFSSSPYFILGPLSLSLSLSLTHTHTHTHTLFFSQLKEVCRVINSRCYWVFYTHFLYVCLYQKANNLNGRKGENTISQTLHFQKTIIRVVPSSQCYLNLLPASECWPFPT